MNMITLLAIGVEDYGNKIIQTKGFIDTLGFGGQMVLLGMGTIFAVLVLLWFCLSIFKVIFYDLPQKKSNKQEKNAIPVVEVEEAVSDDTEIIAVMAAAIAAAQCDAPTKKFRVVSFRRK